MRETPAAIERARWAVAVIFLVTRSEYRSDVEGSSLLFLFTFFILFQRISLYQSESHAR